MEKQEQWMLVRNGLVQRLDADRYGEKVKVWPVFDTQEDAMRFIKWKGTAIGKDVRPALIGSVSGETFEGHIRQAIAEGCVAAVSPRSWTEAGDPVFGYLFFD